VTVGLALSDVYFSKSDRSTRVNLLELLAKSQTLEDKYHEATFESLKISAIFVTKNGSVMSESLESN